MRARVSGFTLIELVVALAIFAAMMVIAQQFLSGALRNREQLQESALKLDAMQRTLVFLTMDMEQLVARPVRDSFGDLQPAVVGTDQRVAVTRLGWANPFDLRKRSRMQRVDWSLEEGQLIRSYLPVLDAGTGTTAERTVLLENVKSLDIRYLEKTADGWQWAEAWPPPASVQPSVDQPLPRSLEITVELEDGRSLHRFFRVSQNPWSLPAGNAGAGGGGLPQ